MSPQALPCPPSPPGRPFSRNLLAPCGPSPPWRLWRAAPCSSQFATPCPQPEGSSGYTEKPGWATEKFAVAAQPAGPPGCGPPDPQGQRLRRRCGHCRADGADAGGAQSSGIGGGAFLLHSTGKTVEATDGREPPPLRPMKTLPGRRRQARAVLRRRGGRPLGGRARHRAHAGDGTQAARQAALGHAVQPAITLAKAASKSARG